MAHWVGLQGQATPATNARKPARLSHHPQKNPNLNIKKNKLQEFLNL